MRSTYLGHSRSLRLVATGGALFVALSVFQPARGAADPERVAAFAVKAAANSRLLYPATIHLDYEEVDSEGDAWVARFTRTRCSFGPERESCEAVPPSGIELQVEHRDDRLAVVAVRGDLPDKARERLLGYSEPVTDDGLVGFEFPSVNLGPKGVFDDAIPIRASYLWRGPVLPDKPEPSFQTCRATLLASDGRPLWESSSRGVLMPRGEGQRSGGVLGFEAPPLDDAVGADISCEPVN